MRPNAAGKKIVKSQPEEGNLLKMIDYPLIVKPSADRRSF